MSESVYLLGSAQTRLLLEMTNIFVSLLRHSNDPCPRVKLRIITLYSL